MKFSSVLLIIINLLIASPSAAQRKIDLDDIEVKGELHSDNRLKFYARQKNQLKNYVKFRQNYRDIIQQETPSALDQWSQEETKTEVTAVDEPTLPLLPEPAQSTASNPPKSGH